MYNFVNHYVISIFVIKYIIIMRITFLLLFIGLNLFSQNLFNEASEIASSYFAKNSKYNKSKIKIDKKNSFILKENNNEVLYVFNFKKHTGFIITSTNKNIRPVLAFSDESNFTPDNIPPAVSSWLKRYKKQINYIITNKIQNTNNQKLWQNAFEKEIGDTLLGPLLTSRWNQGKYYNSACPVDSAGPDFHTLTGCVATATGQILYYYRFPESGTGSYSYDCPGYGTISADFSTANYNYNEMADEFNNYTESGALLLHHLGITFNMEYGPDGSAVWDHSVAHSLRTYFKYGDSTRYLFRDSTTLNWDSIVYVNLVHNKPIYYGGWDDTTYQSGHAFVCDGYKGANYYHFNWGWGGAYDGYYFTDNLTPAGSQFSYAQEMIKDIYPDTLLYEYPTTCTGTDTITSAIGSAFAGNHLKNYENNANCKWFIQPVCGEVVDIYFDRFDLEEGDTLKIKAGSHLLDAFTIDNTPVLSSNYQPTVLHSYIGNATVDFTSDDTLNAKGWQISYESKKCTYYGATFTDSSGTISDGSRQCYYDGGTRCRWTIEPENAEAVLLEFTEFELNQDNDFDYIKIYKNTQTDDSLVAELHHFDSPSQILVPAGKVIIKFESFSGSTAPGWSLNYSKSHITSVNEVSNNFDWKITPNPVKNEINLPIIFKNQTKVEIYDLSGRLVKTSVFNANRTKINVSNLDKGMYVLKIAGYSKKFIKK